MSTTDTPPPAPPGPTSSGPTASGPRVSAEEARDLGRLRRTAKGSPEGRHVAGVAGGLARHFDVDPVLVRVALVVLIFFGGAGLLLYGAVWLLVPEEGSGHAAVQLDDRSRSLALYVAAGLAALALLGDTIGRFDFPWPLAIIALVLLVVLGKRDRLRPADRAQAPGPVPPPTGWATPAPPSSGAPGWVGAAPAPPASGAPGWVGTAADRRTADVVADSEGAGGTGTATAAPQAGAAETPSWSTGWTPGWTPPAGPPAYVPAANPRKRGPRLFWFTLALIALLEGTLGIIDAAGASIPDPAYAALAVGVTGALLLVGAFWGRAGGLILIGLVSTLALGASVASQEYDGNDHRVHATPRLAADVRDGYHLDAGELVLDLTQVGDAAGLDDRTIDLEGGVGKVTVVVPDGWGVGVDAHVGIGNIKVLDHGENGGFGVDYSAHRSASVGQPDITLDAHLGVGAIEVLDEDDYTPGSN